MTPAVLNEYVTLYGIEQEAAFTLQNTFFIESERRADARAGLVAAQVLNVNRTKVTDKVWSATDFFPHLERAARGASADTADVTELSTEETVAHMKKGFGLWVPDGLRARAGL